MSNVSPVTVDCAVIIRGTNVSYIIDWALVQSVDPGLYPWMYYRRNKRESKVGYEIF